VSFVLAWIGLAVLARARKLWVERRRAAARRAEEDARLRARFAMDSLDDDDDAPRARDEALTPGE
jgi:hypothetical protein